MSIGRPVVYYTRAATHLVQELNVGTVHILNSQSQRVVERCVYRYSGLMISMNNVTKSRPSGVRSCDHALAAHSFNVGIKCRHCTYFKQPIAESS